MKKIIISAISLVMILSLSISVSANEDSTFISAEDAFAEMAAADIPTSEATYDYVGLSDTANSYAYAKSGIDVTLGKSWLPISYSGQIIDTFNGVPAYYAPMTSGSPYQCSEYITRYYRQVYGSSLQGYKVTTAPKAGDYIKATAEQRGKSYGHFAVIKSVNGNELTLIEQNWTYKNDGTYYGVKNRVIPYGGQYSGSYTVYSPIGNASNSDGGSAGGTQRFSDVAPSEWFYSAITNLAKDGIINGKTSTIYAPYDSITREEVAKILGKASGKNVDAYDIQRFNDVPKSRWSYTSVNWTKVNKVADGTSATTFSPELNITRQELAQMLYKYAKQFDSSALSPSNAKKNFTDSGSIEGWAKEAVTTMQAAGIINGNDDGSFNPTGSASRAEAATMVSNLLNK